jgi:hypothetical protein
MVCILDILAMRRCQALAAHPSALPSKRTFWRGKSRRPARKLTVPLEARKLIREVSLANCTYRKSHPVSVAN